MTTDKVVLENNGIHKTLDGQFSKERNENLCTSLLSNSEKNEIQHQPSDTKPSINQCDTKQLFENQKKLVKFEKLSQPCGPSNHILLRLFSTFLCAAVSWALLYILLPKEVTPGGKLLTLIFLLFASYFGGDLFKILGLPKLLGMLLTGIIMRNVGLYFDTNVQSVYTDVVATIRQIALTNILITAGLEVDAKTMKRLSIVVLELSFIPCIIEAIGVAIFCKLILNFPWSWGMLVGFVMGAVTPAIVVPALINLQKQGYDEDSKISTIVIAAASFDDLVAISGYGIFYGMIFNEGTTLQNITHGPIEFVLGIVFGILWGIVTAWIPHPEDKHLIAKRVFLVGGGGLMFVLGGKIIGYEGAGPLACIVAAFTARINWYWQGWSPNYNPVKNIFSSLWIILEPALFALIGAEIDLSILQISETFNAFLVILGGLVARSIACSAVLLTADVTFKELLFINVSWIPKATVQAALGPLAFDHAKLNYPQIPENIQRGQITLMIAVLSILFTAPIGAIGINFLGPKLLKKSEAAPETRYQLTPLTEQEQTLPSGLV